MDTQTTVGTDVLSEEQHCCESEMANSTIQWKEDAMKNLGESLKVLDPEDPLMKRFQDALKAHLTRINEKLSEDILNLESDIKDSKKRRESKAVQLYSSEEIVARQQDTLDKYQSKLAELTKFRDEKESRVDETRELRKSMRNELDIEKNIGTKFTQEIESLATLNRHFHEWEKEIVSHTKVSKRMSEKEATVQRELLRRKQQEDYVLSKLMEEVSRLENEIKNCQEELIIKDRERLDAGQMITDANADLDGLQRTQKKLFAEWNHVVASISQRDRVNEELAKERGKIRESFATLSSQIEKLKKDTRKDMENNERLTSMQIRLEDDLRYNFGTIVNEKEKIVSLECQLMETSKLLEQTQNEFDTACWDYQRYLDEEKTIDKEFEKLSNEKVDLEDSILSRLENKVTHDKTVKSLNKKLRDIREKMREEELTMLQTENNYGKNILELEKLNASIATERYDVEDFMRMNNRREKELDVMQNELKKCDTMIGKKQHKIVSLNKKIEEIISSLPGGEEVSPQDLKITELEKRIEETESSNRRSEEFWLRQEGYMVTLSEERTAQLQEINLLEKQITIMEQRSLKLEHEIEIQRKEDENTGRTVKMLQQKLTMVNARLAIQREAHDDLEDKNCMSKSECIETLREAEIELLKLQNDIKQLNGDRESLEEELKSAQRETLSWEKKVHLASETAKKLKEERGAGGDVAVMKSEIHKMEMRLGHLRKAQEKMIRDMEFCVARRDVIMDGAMAREKRNPKGLHNQKVIFEKRMNDQRLKIKQMSKETKQMENQILELENQEKSLLEQLDENNKTLEAYENNIPEIDEKINEAELLKFHKLECLVRKQRKIRMLQDIKDGRYKMLFKSEISLNDELQKQRNVGVNLREIMEETRRDFPLLKDDIDKILLGMEAS